MTKPDVDNNAKTILDVMNKIIYNDDSQVYKMTIEKVFIPFNVDYDINEKTIVKIKYNKNDFKCDGRITSEDCMTLEEKKFIELIKNFKDNKDEEKMTNGKFR